MKYRTIYCLILLFTAAPNISLFGQEPITDSKTEVSFNIYSIYRISPMYLTKETKYTRKILVNDHDFLTGPGLSSSIGITFNKTKLNLSFGTTLRYDHIFFRYYTLNQKPFGYLESVKSILLDYSFTITKKFQLKNRRAIKVSVGFNLMNRESEFALYETDTVPGPGGLWSPILLSSSTSYAYNAYFIGGEFEIDKFLISLGGYIPDYMNENLSSNRYFILPEIKLGYRIK